MLHLDSILACGSMDITAGAGVFILFVGLFWIAACILCLANLFFIFEVSRSPSFRLGHFFVFLSYIGLALFLFYLEKIIRDQDLSNITAQILVMVIPLYAIGHFIYLFGRWRELKRADKKDH